MDVSYPDDSYPGSDVSYPLSVSSYPTNCHREFLEFLSEKLVKTIKMQRSHAQDICVILFAILVNFT